MHAIQISNQMTTQKLTANILNKLEKPQ